MNGEKYKHIIDEAYECYFDTIRDDSMEWFNKEEFINKIKNNPGFSERFGVKIEEEELNLERRKGFLAKELMKSLDTFPVAVRAAIIWIEQDGQLEESFENYKIPTKLITVTYNNETIEIYEQRKI